MNKPAQKYTREWEPSTEQLHIVSLAKETKNNLIIFSPAGGAKTSTLELLQEILSSCLCIAFNVRIVKEMERRFSPFTKVKTFNGLGHSTWYDTIRTRLTVEGADKKDSNAKTKELLKLAIRNLSKRAQGDASEQYWDIIAAVNLAKTIGYIPSGAFPHAKPLATQEDLISRLEEEPSDLLLDLLDEVLVASIKAAYAGSIDYNDQIYMPALFGGTFPRDYANIIIDEAQDASPINHEMLWHLRASRLFAVGDDRQSIYAFRGAVPGGMAKLQKRFEMTPARLTVSFRCPEAIVRNAQWRAPEMRWYKTGGKVGRLRHFNASAFADDSAIICRNNAPLFSLALRLLASGRAVNVSGSDVGYRVVGIMRKLGSLEITQQQLLFAIEDWRNEKLAKQSTSANDLADCMCVFAKRGENLGQAIAYAEDLFAQHGPLSLLTGHKSKGLEWRVVYHLDPFLIREDEQDLNLRYVIQTRALEEYYEIETKEITW
jgi:superfamily I DNA/RNA helicase